MGRKKAEPEKAKQQERQFNVHFSFKEPLVDEVTLPAIVNVLVDNFGELTYFNFSEKSKGAFNDY